MMKQRIMTLCIAALMVVQGYCGVTLTVPDVNIAPGSSSNVVIYYDLGAEPYTAYQLDIAYPEGISSVSDEDGNPAFTAGDVYNKEHIVSSIYTSKGLDRFQCFSITSLPLTSQSGILLVLPIKAQKTLAEGTYTATISPIEFVQTNATPDRPEAVTFNIKVTKRVVLDESSTVAPSAAEGVEVQVKRTINADEWSTICLPFAMSEEQLTATFGSDVELADFTSWTSQENGDGAIVAINVSFAKVTAMEANHPYIIKVSEKVDEFTVKGVDIAPVATPTVQVGANNSQRGFMYGTYVTATIPAENLFLSGNKFWYSVGKTQTKAFRGYFKFRDVLEEYYGNAANASSRISFSFNDEPTGIVGITLSESQDDIFDLQGRKVETPSKGIYIRNGKKLKK